MNRFFKKSLVLIALVGAMTASKAEAAFFTGQVDYAGSQTSDVADLTLATQSALSSVLVIDATGSFAAAGIAFTNPLVHASPLVYRPVPGVPYAPLWSHVASGISFDLLTLAISSSSSNSLFLTGTGVFKGGGYDDTPGLWNLTLQNQGGVRGSFSSTSIVPEPASLALLGMGLAGVAAARRRRQA